MLKSRMRAGLALLAFAGSLALILPLTGGSAHERSARVDARALATLTDLDGLAVSPDGRWAAFLTRQGDPSADSYTQRWLAVPIAGGALRRLSDGGDPIQAARFGRINGGMQNPAPVWSPDSQWIAYLRKENGRTQIWRAHIDGRGAEQLTQGESDARALVFSEDGRRLLYETEPSPPQIAAALAEEGRAGFLYDKRFLPVHSTTPVLPADVRLGDGEARLTTPGQDALRAVLVYDFARRASRPAAEAERAEFQALTRARAPEGREGYRGDGVLSPAAASSPSGALAWTEARDPERQGGFPPLTIVAQPPGAHEPVVCAAEPCTGQRINGFWWRNDAEVIFARGEGILFQDAALYAWRIGDAAPRLILRTPNVFLPLPSKCATAQDRLVCFYEEPARPRRLVAIDLETGAVETLFDPNPQFAPLDLGAPPQRIEFRSPSGVANYGYLVMPPGRRMRERLSLVVVTYRCSGFLRGGTGDEYPIFAFAAAGHAVLCFNVPEPDYQRLARMDSASYQNWARGESQPAKRRVQEGLETAIAELVRRGIVDPARVGVTGLSFGAETTSYALWHMPRLGAAIASSDGFFEPSSAFLYGPAGREALRAWGLSDPDSPAWNDLSLSRNVARVRAPFLVNVSDHEMIGSLQSHTALQDANRAVEMYVFPHEYHIKHQPAHRLAIYNRNIDWMNFWLRGVEDPDPAKAAQYERWRAMRENQCRLFGPNGTERRADEDPPWYCRR